MHENDRNEVCVLEFNNMKERMDKFEKSQLQRDDDMKVIEKAIVAIQVANEQTARTLEKMDAKMEGVQVTQKHQFWTEDTKKSFIKYGAIIIVVVILALVGTNMLEAMKIVTLK